MDVQRLRNLTTGRLHTEIGCVYEDLEMLTGMKGLMTHMLPRTMRDIEPWLKEKVTDSRFWDGEYDKSHIGDFDLPEPTKEEQSAFLEAYKAMPDPLEGKDVVAVSV